MIFSKKDLKQFKRNQLDSDSVKISKTFCSVCSAIITFSQVWTMEVNAGVITLPAQDDNGYILGGVIIARINSVSMSSIQTTVPSLRAHP